MERRGLIAIMKEDKKPERDRCFYNLLADPNGGIKKIYHCIFSSKDGRTPYNVEKAALAANEWVMKTSVNVNKAKLEADQKALSLITVDIDPNSKELKAIKEAVFNYAVQYDKDCESKIKLSTPGVTQEKCDKEKIPGVTAKISELCKKNKPCEKAIAEAIKNGDLPLSAKGVGNAMSPENPFKGQGSGPSVASQQPNEESEDEADKKLDAVMSEIGLKKDAQEKVKQGAEEEEVGTDKPTKEELMKAINTFKRVFQGKVIDKVKGIEEFCHNNDFMTRAVALLPFLSRFDPWLEYLGYIRDQQSAKK